VGASAAKAGFSFPVVNAALKELNHLKGRSSTVVEISACGNHRLRNRACGPVNGGGKGRRNPKSDIAATKGVNPCFEPQRGAT
jgi:hypothetical protein